MKASEKGYTEIVKILVEQEGIDINAKSNVYFNHFIFQSSIWSFFKLFNAALMRASNNGHTEIVKILIEQEGIDLNAKNEIYFNDLIFQNNIWNFFKLFWTALIWASYYGHTEIVKILVEQEGIDINAKDIVYFNNIIFQNDIWNFFKLFRTALIWAYLNGHTEIVKILVKQEGIEINAKDNVYFNNLIFQNNFWNLF